MNKYIQVIWSYMYIYMHIYIYVCIYIYEYIELKYISKYALGLF